jgi:hypothetical protein
MAQRVIDPQELRRMVEAGKTYPEIAAHYNVTVSGVQQAVERIGLQKKALSHKKFVPWRVQREHSHSGPATSLRRLSSVSQGRQVPLEKLNTALRWATRLYEDNLDIDYDENTGFFEKPAEEPDWHIRMVLDTVREALKK